MTILYKPQPRTMAEADTLDMVSVKDHGARGDGNIDDIDAINDASRYARDNDKGIVFFPPGHYMISTHVIGRSDMIFMGSGSKTIIELMGSEERERGTAMNCIGRENVVFRDFVLKCNKYSEEGIEVENSTNVTLINLDIYGAYHDATDFDHDENIIVWGCRTYNSGKCGIHFSNQSKNGIVMQSYAYNIGWETQARAAFDSTNDAENITFVGNVAENCHRGFMVFRARYNTFNSNVAYDCEEGFTVDTDGHDNYGDSKDNTFTSNLARNCSIGFDMKNDKGGEDGEGGVIMVGNRSQDCENPDNLETVKEQSANILKTE